MRNQMRETVHIKAWPEFELWCWRRFLRVSWIVRRSNHWILKEISPEYSLEGLMLKLKLQFFGHLMWRADSFEKTLMLGTIGGRRRRGWQRMKWLDGIIDSSDECEQTPRDSECQKPGMLQFLYMFWSLEINTEH